mmetsp:Transcript_77000/g.238478  ORF Transcript_77000/g.238478 Transcript_77000/m.238478 type:complete len:600 (-) Transcript_77000:133-1932(-)|eukprot:CAMPEP_0204577478 /NCGR_PEP_ID=MMETSP0661-20131031/42358_1 /ASSEMBLY_ACC=CAM_ASM_000606 /TAXON_ID=109239 /ORGANISM="Alexandrium margalefi, Strain AMGDE01CS-322" /LENGTH=599 /DNA_ID=CAMNT_0051586319 /DNA_START=75 /DNA_END=1874 /DNA_ORIENTATION=+
MNSAASITTSMRSPLDDMRAFGGASTGNVGKPVGTGTTAAPPSSLGAPGGGGTGAAASSSAALPPGLAGAPVPEEEAPVRLASQDEFSVMVGDIRKTFTLWLEKAEQQIHEECVTLRKERQEFEEEKARVWQEFVGQKQSECDRIRDDRRRAEAEVAGAARQIRQEREDARVRLQEERQAIERDIQQGRRRFILEREKFRTEYESAEKERQRISDHNVATETMVDINVGGAVFEAARQTYTQQPGSLLERLLTGRAQAPRDRDGRIFLDRDSSLFRTILNFLRDPSSPPVSRDAAESEALCQEADYLGIRFYPFPLVYAVGGHDGADHLSAAEVLDVENQCWRPCRPMRTERTYFGSEVSHSRLYLFGGQNLEYKALCETECFDCLRGEWMAGADLNVPRRNCASARLDGRIYAMGGFDGTQILSHVEAFDPRMKNWMPLEPMTTPRSSAAATTYGGRLWVLGGTSGSRLRTIERFDPRAGRWEAVRSDMIEVRSAGRASNCLDRLYAVGGTDQNQSVHSSLECYNQEAGGSWIFRKSMQMPRMDFGCCVLSDSIMVGGGQHGEVLGSTEFYRPELDEWQLGPPMLSPRYGHSLLLVDL